MPGRAARAGLAACLAALGAGAAGDPPLAFQDISAVSGGPVDFGTPPSDVEKPACAFLDADGDGWDDLVTLTGAGHPFGYFLNRPGTGGTRRFVAAPPGNGLDTGPALARDGSSLCAGDVDGDGDTDLFVGCGYSPLLADGRNMLLLNDGAGNFTDVAPALGIEDGNNTTSACVFLDMDLDGDLDLLYANANSPVFGKFGDGKTRLLRNMLRETGSLGFVDETATRLVTGANVGAWATVAFDYDGDGDPDILHTRDLVGLTELHRNDGTGVFTDVSSTVGAGAGDDADPSTFGDDTDNAMGVAAADPDNDGDLDFYITDIGGHFYYRNNGDGTLTERGASSGIRGGHVGWGCNFADFDLDGLPDLYVATGTTYGLEDPTSHPYLFRNLGGGVFEEVPWDAAGLRSDPPLNREHGSSVADIDGDGDPDLLVVRAHKEGASPYLYRNDTDRGDARWIGIRLRGDGFRSNPDAIGARVRVFGRDAGGALVPGAGQVQEVMSSSSRASVSSFELLFGLPPGTATVDVQVVWPRSGALPGRTTLVAGLAPDARHAIEDGTGTAPASLLPTASSAAVGGGEVVVAVPGGEGPNAPHPVVVHSGPSWATVTGDAQAGWGLRFAPPVADAVRFHTVVLHGGKAPGLSIQDHGVTVVSPPFVTSAVPRRRARRIDLAGANFPEGACTVLVDGVPARKVVYLGAEDPDGDRTALRILAAKAPKGATTRTVVVTSGTTGLGTGAVEVPVRLPRKARK